MRHTHLVCFEVLADLRQSGVHFEIYAIIARRYGIPASTRINRLVSKVIV